MYIHCKNRGKLELDVKRQVDLYRQLLLTYESCIRTKARLKRSLFHLHYEEEIERLSVDICCYRYKPWLSNIFIVFYPKPREIIAAHVRDRLVHHFIYNYMAPYWERRFSPRSYACRKDKGPLQAVKDLQSFIQNYLRHNMGGLYYLKVDIASFFPTIDIDILRKIIFKKLRNPLYQYLVDVTLKHRPVDKGQFILRSPKSHWSKMPRCKSMFYAPKNKGLPIGNLTSQFFANIYLNELDQFVTHQLKGRCLYWQRYVDDIIFISKDRHALKKLPVMIDSFLRKRLSLQLNPRKTILQPLARGIDHLGYWIKPDHTLIRQKNVRACSNKIRQSLSYSPEDFRAMIHSYFGHYSHGSSYRLRRSLAFKSTLIEWQGKKVRFTADYKKMLLKPCQDVLKKRVFREKELLSHFENYYKPLKPQLKSHYVQNWKPLDPLLSEAEAILS